MTLRRIAVKGIELWNRISITFVTSKGLKVDYRFLDDINSQNNNNDIPPYDNNFEKCFVPNCPPGEYKSFSLLAQHGSPWNNSVGWLCLKCNGNTVKSSWGDALCQDCPELTIPNQNKTTCYDPYILVFPNIQDLIVQILIACSVVLIMAISFNVYSRSSSLNEQLSRAF